MQNYYNKNSKKIPKINPNFQCNQFHVSLMFTLKNLCWFEECFFSQLICQRVSCRQSNFLIKIIGELSNSKVFNLEYQIESQMQSYLLHLRFNLGFKIKDFTLWVAAKLNQQISPRRVLDMFYPISCFQQAFWLNVRHSMSPLNNIYDFWWIF